MKLNLDGQVTTQFRADVESVRDQYNIIFENSDFSISRENTLKESNTHLYFGEAANIYGLWDDMFEIIN